MSRRCRDSRGGNRHERLEQVVGFLGFLLAGQFTFESPQVEVEQTKRFGRRGRGDIVLAVLLHEFYRRSL